MFLWNVQTIKTNLDIFEISALLIICQWDLSVPELLSTHSALFQINFLNISEMVSSKQGEPQLIPIYKKRKEKQDATYTTLCS